MHHIKNQYLRYSVTKVMEKSVQIVGNKSIGIFEDNKYDYKVQKMVAAIKIWRRMRKLESQLRYMSMSNAVMW